MSPERSSRSGPYEEDVDPPVSEQDLSPLLTEMETVPGERWAGAWIDRSYGTSLCVAVVEPHVHDVERLHELAFGAGWRANVVGARYSKAALDAFKERLTSVLAEPDAAGKWIALGPALSLNKVRVELSAVDPELIAKLLQAVPPDAISLRLLPGAKVIAMQGESQ